MAGSFDVFRRYQKSLLVFVAIMAMLAFFVLPPFLQMGSGTLAGDPLVARWSGGEVREADLERSVSMRAILNRFLIEAAVQAGRDPSRLPLFPESEDAVVRTRLIVEEAREVGIVVTDAAINEFLADWTNNQVRAEQFSQILSGLRLSMLGASETDVFEALRYELTARNMLLLFQTGFSGDPPGWRWDAFRRLQQKAIVEVIPVTCESLADRVAAPSESSLQALYDEYREFLPVPASAEPGFREPHRVAFEYLTADQALFVDALKPDVTDEEIAAYYEENKAIRYRALPGSSNSAEEPAAEEPAAEEPAAEEPAAEEPAAEEPAAEDGSSRERAGRSRFSFVSARADDGEEPAATAEESAAEPANPEAPAESEAPADESATEAPAAAEVAVESAETTAEPASATESEAADVATEPAAEASFRPLAEVAEEIREQLASERAEQKINEIFAAVAADLTAYGEEYALWQARGETGTEPPTPPDFAKIAETQGLTSGRSDLVAPVDAVEEPGIGRSFDLVPDPGSRFGIRQRSWLEMMFGEGAQVLRPQTSRDLTGNRFLSWKTQDQPEFVPTFAAAKENVEKAWRIIEARDLAQKEAEQLAEQSKSRDVSLEQLAADRGDVEMTQAGPFAWYDAASGVPEISQPPGVFLPGNEFMQAVFRLVPGETAVAFNEPKTVCYCVRLLSLTPPDSELRAQFLDRRDDVMSLDQVAQQSYGAIFERWIEGLEDRYNLRWERQPRQAGR
jgi:hypothetical protein